MKLDADEDLAMILPIPVVQPAKDDAVTFNDLSQYVDFFKDLDKAFPEPMPFGENLLAPAGSKGRAPTLAVHRVGSFDASFVPNIAAFARLDAQFRLDDEVWKSLPQYEDFGFVVFKLRKGKQHVHPMAFRFPSVTPGRIFFPTVHIHDGKVHETEAFDHTLYAQAWKTAVIKGPHWNESASSAGQVVKIGLTQDLVWGGGHLYKMNLVGIMKNQDTIAEARKMG